MWNPTLTPYASPESTRGARWGAAPAPGLFNCHFTYTFYFCKQHKSKLKTPNKQTQQISINNLPLLWFCTNKSDIFRKRNCILKAHKKPPNSKWQSRYDITPWLRSHVALSPNHVPNFWNVSLSKSIDHFKNCRSFIGWPWNLCSKNALIKRQSDAQVTVKKFLICLCKRRVFQRHLGANLKTINTYGTTKRNGGLKCPLSQFGSSQKCTEYCIFRQTNNCR